MGTRKMDFKERVWKPILWPVTTLVCICLLTSLLLGLTNSVTAPIIERNAAAAADAARRELLPEADSFTQVPLSPLPANITAMYAADNGAGYVIEAYGQGYGGKVPVMVAFDENGDIAGVKFLENTETPGLGKNLETNTGIPAQFAGLPAQLIPSGEVDMIAGATISSNAALTAINAAVALYADEVLGEPLDPDAVATATEKDEDEADATAGVTQKDDEEEGA